MFKGLQVQNFLTFLFLNFNFLFNHTLIRSFIHTIYFLFLEAKCFVWGSVMLLVWDLFRTAAYYLFWKDEVHSSGPEEG